jgi:hypothetical protein
MTDKNLMDDSALALALRNLYLDEVDRARREPKAALVAVRGSPQTRAKTWSPLAAAVIVLVIAIVAVGSQLARSAPSAGEPGSANPGGAPTTGSLNPSAETSASAVGPIVDGIPVTIGGERVLRGTDAIGQRIENSTDDTSFLVGGRFHKGGLNILCPAVLSYLSVHWWLCSTIQVYERAQGDEQHQGTGAVWIYPGDPLRIEWETATSAVRPVVLRIHTHDASCPARLQGCSSLPVLVEVVWLGPAA